MSYTFRPTAAYLHCCVREGADDKQDELNGLCCAVACRPVCTPLCVHYALLACAQLHSRLRTELYRERLISLSANCCRIHNFIMFTNRPRVWTLLWISLSASSIALCEGTDPVDWWKRTVVYQIYPRSFQDSDGDGVGDLRGGWYITFSGI